MVKASATVRLPLFTRRYDQSGTEAIIYFVDGFTFVGTLYTSMCRRSTKYYLHEGDSYHLWKIDREEVRRSGYNVNCDAYCSYCLTSRREGQWVDAITPRTLPPGEPCSGWLPTEDQREVVLPRTIQEANSLERGDVLLPEAGTVLSDGTMLANNGKWERFEVKGEGLFEWHRGHRIYTLSPDAFRVMSCGDYMSGK